MLCFMLDSCVLFIFSFTLSLQFSIYHSEFSILTFLFCVYSSHFNTSFSIHFFHMSYSWFFISKLNCTKWNNKKNKQPSTLCVANTIQVVTVKNRKLKQKNIPSSVLRLLFLCVPLKHNPQLFQQCQRKRTHRKTDFRHQKLHCTLHHRRLRLNQFAYRFRSYIFANFNANRQRIWKLGQTNFAKLQSSKRTDEREWARSLQFYGSIRFELVGNYKSLIAKEIEKLRQSIFLFVENNTEQWNSTFFSCCLDHSKMQFMPGQALLLLHTIHYVLMYIFTYSTPTLVCPIRGWAFNFTFLDWAEVIAFGYHDWITENTYFSGSHFGPSTYVFWRRWWVAVRLIRSWIALRRQRTATMGRECRYRVIRPFSLVAAVKKNDLWLEGAFLSQWCVKLLPMCNFVVWGGLFRFISDCSGFVRLSEIKFTK